MSQNWMQQRLDKTSDSLRRAIADELTGYEFESRNGKVLRLTNGHEAVEFISCSYLGLEEHPAIVQAAERTTRTSGLQFSSSRTRVRHGDLSRLERNLGAIYGDASATCFISVSSVHLGLLPLLGVGALPSYPVSPVGVTFYVDRTAHSSMQVLRGVYEQIGPVRRFDSSDLDALAGQLSSPSNRDRTPVILVDGVGSMGGLVDVGALLKLAERYAGYLYVDDAHGVSTVGSQGGGYAYQEFGSALPANAVIAGSMAKAFGGTGGFSVLASEKDSEVLRRFANPLIFGGPLALPVVSGNLASSELHLSGEVEVLQKNLWANVRLFDSLTGCRLVNANHISPIRGALFDDEEAALESVRRLKVSGILTTVAFYPTVEKGRGLIRFALSALHTEDQIRRAAAALAA